VTVIRLQFLVATEIWVKVNVPILNLDSHRRTEMEMTL